MSKFVDAFMQQAFVIWFLIVPCYFVGIVHKGLVLPFFVGSALFVNWYVFGHSFRVPPLPHVIKDGVFYLKIMAFSYVFWLFLLFIKF